MPETKMRQRRGWTWTAETGFIRVKALNKLNKLKKQKVKTMPNNTESAALNELLNTLNSGAIPAAPAAPAAEEGTGQVWIETPPANAASVLPPKRVDSSEPYQPGHTMHPAPPRPAVQKIFFTGRLKSGKDHAAQLSGAHIIGFADPLYSIVSHYFGITVTSTTGKDTPGVRELLQIVGQWGRGIINEKYPLTIPRALFLDRVRNDGDRGIFGFNEVNWPEYGNDADLWLNAAIVRANSFLDANPAARVAVTNCRFDNEFKALVGSGFQHWHVMCSPKTWAARLAKDKLTPESPAVKDLSEALAAKLDQNVIQQVSTVKQGPTLRAIWSDEAVPKPSARLHTVESFLKSLRELPIILTMNKNTKRKIAVARKEFNRSGFGKCENQTVCKYVKPPVTRKSKNYPRVIKRSDVYA